MSGAPAGRAVVLVAALCAALPARAADYIWMRADGTPRTWASPVTYNPDLGSLGLLDNDTARARLRAAFDTWAAVDTSTLRNLREGRQLPRDATVDTFRNSYSKCDDDFSAIIFDTDGSILDDLLGDGARTRTLGVGFPNCVDDDGDIVQGTIVLNGRFLDGVDEPGNGEYSPDRFQNVIVHEIGHFLNIAHTQAGLAAAFDNDPGNDALVPVMFPIAVRPEGAELQLDDIAAISELYGTATFRNQRGRISGRVFDGQAQFAGANLVARRVDDPERAVVAAASGGRYDVDNLEHPPEHLKGFYLIPGLPPGEYTLELEQLARFYNILPVGAPTLPGPREFWNGANESASTPPDDPDEVVTIAVAGGDDLRNVDLVVNQTNPVPANDLCEAAAEVAALPFQTALDTRFATVDRPRCPNETKVVGNAVWFRYTASAAGMLDLRAASDAYRPVIAALTSACGDDAAACSVVGDPSLRLPVEAGQTVSIAVADGDFGGGGTVSFSAAWAPAGPPPCVADCDADGAVAINEITRAVRVALGIDALTACPDADRSGDALVQISEIVAAIAAALNGCV